MTFSAFVSTCSFTGAPLHNRTSNLCQGRLKLPHHAKSVIFPVMSANVLIVNTKGGGHGHIGLHLAQKLLEEGNSVHIHQVGPEGSCAPVKQYPTLESTHGDKFSVKYGDIPSSYPTNFSAIYDNNAKSADDIAPAIESAKSSGAQLFYVSSAGAYKYDSNVAPHNIKDRASGATIDVENTIREAGVSSATFRPIYIIGPHTSKREYVDFFFDRIVRGRPVPLPGCGDEITSITDVRDIASLLSSALGKSLKDDIINCVNTRGITFNGMVKLCAEACGQEAKTVYYDPNKMEQQIEGFKVKKAFPFRPRHFFADPCEAQIKLGWKPEVSGSVDGLSKSIKECYDEYVELGLDKAEVDFSLDDKILQLVQ